MAQCNKNQRGVTNVKTSETTGGQRGTELYFSKYKLADFSTEHAGGFSADLLSICGLHTTPHQAEATARLKNGSGPAWEDDPGAEEQLEAQERGPGEASAGPR
jgi:hypothetical protein